MAKKFITEETTIVFEKYEDLSYYESGTENVDLFVKGDYVGEIEVFTDRGNEEREYICINNEMVYLDTITCLNPNE
jgi:hypothetical protein